MAERSVALITGASQGLGRDLAELFAQDGHDVVLVARSRDKLETLATEVKEAHGVQAHVLPADLTNPAVPEEIFGWLTREHIQLDYLVNNAGFGSHGTFWELPRKRELDMIEVNITALVNLTHLALQGMIARGKGRVLNIASTAGFQPGPGMSTYYATKAFVTTFTEGVAHELKGTGVTATAHCPGATATGFAGTAGNAETPLFRFGLVADSKSVARHAYRSMMKGKTVAIAGFMNRLLAFTVRFSPRWMVRYVAAFANGW